MVKRSRILAAASALAFCLAGAASSPALADWHGHGHWHGHWHGHGGGLFLGFNFGWPGYYYPPRYYYPPPVYYAPPPPAAPICRVFHGNARIDANGAPFYGTACLQADGRWHIVP